jgi:transcriptional regulator NrdR family protein
MNCPHCHTEAKGVVLETRKQDDSIIRKRACGHCGKGFCTREVPDASIVMKRERPDKIAKRADIEPGPKVTNLDAFKAWR